jgi:hypothetical protein
MELLKNFDLNNQKRKENMAEAADLEEEDNSFPQEDIDGIV